MQRIETETHTHTHTQTGTHTHTDRQTHTPMGITFFYYLVCLLVFLFLSNNKGGHAPLTVSPSCLPKLSFMFLGQDVNGNFIALYL